MIPGNVLLSRSLITPPTQLLIYHTPPYVSTPTCIKPQWQRKFENFEGRGMKILGWSRGYSPQKFIGFGFVYCLWTTLLFFLIFLFFIFLYYFYFLLGILLRGTVPLTENFRGETSCRFHHLCITSSNPFLSNYGMSSGWQQASDWSMKNNYLVIISLYSWCSFFPHAQKRHGSGYIHLGKGLAVNPGADTAKILGQTIQVYRFLCYVYLYLEKIE